LRPQSVPIPHGNTLKTAVFETPNKQTLQTSKQQQACAAADPRKLTDHGIPQEAWKPAGGVV
jgi:hypothetical protein